MSASEFDKDQYPMLEVKSELILEAGGEGGSIKLLGTRVPNGWRFRTSTSQGESDWVASWEAALKLLDKYPWHMSPSPTISHAIVHPELRELVLLAVWKRFDLPGSPFSQRLAFGPLEECRRFCQEGLSV